MELAWNRRIGLTATVAAYSTTEDELNLAVFEIEGLGAGIYLSMDNTNVNFEKQIESITAQIIKKYKPDKIILFGGAARGKGTADSDAEEIRNFLKGRVIIPAFFYSYFWLLLFSFQASMSCALPAPINISKI